MIQDYYGTMRVTAYHETKNGIDGYGITNERGNYHWLRKRDFERVYQPVLHMDFSKAMHAMKKGNKVARAGWYAYGEWIAITPGSEVDAKHAREGHAIEHRAKEMQTIHPEGHTSIYGSTTIGLSPHMDKRYKDGSMMIGWTPSQEDLFATDWGIVGG